MKNLSYKITADDLYDLFGKYGGIRQIRLGTSQDTKGTAFVVYDELLDAKAALEGLNGFNVQGRYLVVLYHTVEKMQKSMEKRQEELDRLKQQYNIGSEDA